MKTVEEVDEVATNMLPDYIKALGDKPSSLPRASAFTLLYTNESYIVRDMIATALHKLAIGKDPTNEQTPVVDTPPADS